MSKILSFIDAITHRGQKQNKNLQSVDDRGWTRIFDWTPGAWQTHHPYDTEKSVLAYPAVFACTTLIQSDVGKLRPTVQQWVNGIWVESIGHSVAKLLRKPNNYQNHIKFKEHWLNSKLVHGNTYVLKIRGIRGEIEVLHILDPLKVTPLVADNGDVYYRLNEDRLAELDEGQVVVPASEIIHDRFNCLYHPLVGLSPIFACGSSATMGLDILKNSKNFFKNGSNPGGILTAPGSISSETAERLKKYWQENFTGNNSGKIAAMGDGLKYEPMRMTNVDAQLIEHFNWSAETVCSTFHVPSYKIGVGAMPSYNNIEALNIGYYSDCLQSHIESMEAAIDDGLELGDGFRTQLDLDTLFRMDQSTLTKMLSDGLKGIVKPDEARKRLNLPPVAGGDAVYMQQQNYSLEALAKRDAKKDPFASGSSGTTEDQNPPNQDPDEIPDDEAEQTRDIINLLIKLDRPYVSQQRVHT